MQHVKMYRSIWYDRERKEMLISTRNPDGSIRDIDEMEQVWRDYCKFRRNSSALHDWQGTAIAGLTCTKCHAWCNTWHDPPERGCNDSRSLLLLENV